MSALARRPVSAGLARALQARGVHYGWIVALVTFLTMLATAGAMGAAGVMLKPLQQEFGWSSAQISMALALRLLLYGLMGPFSAAFMIRFGLSRVVVTALVFIMGGLIASCFMTQIWQLVLLWGFVVGFGSGLTALVLGATVATRWFSARRGLVVGFLTASNATGQLIFLPALASLTENWGWRAALSFAVLMLALALGLVAMLMRDYPEDIGLRAYGAPADSPAGQGAPAGEFFATLLLPISILREAARTKVFWVLFSSFFVCGLSTNGLIQTHWISFCADNGLPPVGAAGLLAVIGAFDFVGTILSGWLSDRYDNRWLLFVYYSGRGLSLLYLPFSDFSLPSLSIFAVLYGLDWVATVPPTVKLTAERFGPQKSGVIFGWIFAGHQLGAATAAYGAGVTRTLAGAYGPALLAIGLCCLAASMLVISLPRASAPREAAISP